jgi:hypothetical protein
VSGCFSAILYLMSWAQRRKFLYLGTIAAIFIIIAAWIFIAYYYQAPTCFDKKQNGDEFGIDCGGSCSLLCSAQYVPLTVLWSRFSKVSDGVYNALAYIENPNVNAGANNLNYVFKLYDKNGLLLRERAGNTFAPPNKIMAVFEPELLTGNQIPARVEFSFTSQALWLKQNSVENSLSVSESVVQRADTAPRLSALITNKTTNQIKKIEAIGIVYNSAGNTIAFSRTIIDGIAGKGVETVNFNWPKPFTDTYARTEIILKVLK